MSNIILHQIDNISVGLDKKDGYLNATKLCAAYSAKKGVVKRPEHWLSTKRAKSYIAYVASVTGITVTPLVVTKQGGDDEQGTWIHPDLGNAFSSWLSVEYEYAVAKWIQNWRSDKSSSEYPKQITGNIAFNATAELIGRIHTVFDLFFPTMTPEFLLGMKIEAACTVDPTLRPMLEPHKPKLLLESPLLSPTDIGKILEAKDGVKRSAQAINKLLIDRNLQVATGDKKLAYKAIGQGIEFSKVVADTAAGHGKTIQSLRWYESVTDLLKDIN
jgi:KilA-N domain